MAMQELFIEVENGQVEINWDALELITSVEFVDYIKKDLETDMDFLKSIEVMDLTSGNEVFVYVFVVAGSICKRYSFADGDFKRIVVNNSTIEIFSRMLGGVK